MKMKLSSWKPVFKFLSMLFATLAGSALFSSCIQQKAALFELLKQLHRDYPKARIIGHKELPHVAKECPCFDAVAEYSQLNDNQKLGKADVLSV